MDRHSAIQGTVKGMAWGKVRCWPERMRDLGEWQSLVG